MDGEACPLPQPRGDDEAAAAVTAAAVERLLASRVVAVVGMSADPGRAGHYVPAYLAERGYDVIPVNPNVTSVLGRRAYPSLAEVPRPVDLVLVFRRPEHCPAVAEQAAAVGAKGIWLQSGIRSPEARRLAEAAGLTYVEDRCMMVEHRRSGR